MHNFDMQNSID